MAGVVNQLESLGKSDPRIVRLRTIPGVGPRTAEILVACIDDPHRFDNGRQVSAYFGLVPRQYQSTGAIHLRRLWSPFAPLEDSLRRGERPTSDSDEGTYRPTGKHCNI